MNYRQPRSHKAIRQMLAIAKDQQTIPTDRVAETLGLLEKSAGIILTRHIKRKIGWATMDACTIIPLNDRLQQLSQMGDPLEALNTTIPWETFRPVLMKVHDKVRKSKAGRPAFDVILMFKLLILKTLYNLSDDQLEYQVRDRLSFMRFLGLTLTDVVPDATTVWRFREQLKTARAADAVVQPI